MLLPDDCIPILKLQRSNYKKHPKKEYSADMEIEFNSMLPFLPEKINSIIDIGCGLGGIDVLLSHYYDFPRMYLIDKDKVDKKVTYGFTEIESYYNNFELLRKIMTMNNIKNYRIIDNDNFNIIRNTDLIISLLACGFHFPLYYYFAKIYESLNENGIFICDIRKGQEGQLKIIQLYFKIVEEIKTDNLKTIRIFAKEKKCLELQRTGN